MGMKKGQTEYKKFLNGQPLSRKQAILAQCFVCNGEEETGEDCLGTSCPLYQYMPYKSKKVGLKRGFPLT
jgi:hypothetical protein